MNFTNIKFDCKYFQRDIPCLPNKLRGQVCDSCNEYAPISKRILIIKLGAIGDVIRSTPLVIRYRDIYPSCHISWITHSPEILPQNVINEVYEFNFKSVYILTHQKFDIAVNLDKDPEACGLLQDVDSEEKYGFMWKEGHIDAATQAAEHKIISGLFDQYSKNNTKSYLEEIFEICGFSFNQEPYILEINPELSRKWKVLNKEAGHRKIVGLNTGCGKRWLTRLWPAEYWIELIRKLQQKDLYPILLGGPDEDAQNLDYAKTTEAYYPGVMPLEEFIAFTSHCDLIVTSVTMMMHIAIGLKKPLILFNNIFNRNEFELYGRGKIIEPATGCDCFYGNQCNRRRHCMKDISVDEVLQSILEYIYVR